MHLYEINRRAVEILEQFEPDPETGAVRDDIDTDALLEELNSLDENKENILVWVGKQIINLRAEVTSLKAEEDRLGRIRKSKENAIDKFIKILDRECGGENRDFGIGKLSHRRSVQTIVKDQAQAINWLFSNQHEECIKLADPEIRKDAVKKLINSGQNVPGVALEENISTSFK